MPDIVITPNRGTSTNPKIDFTGVTTGTIKLEVLSDGSLSFNGANGSLFSIADSVTGSLMSVNDTSGLPILEVFSTDKVVMGKYNQNTLVVDGTNGRIGIGTGSPTDKLTIAGTSSNGITLNGSNSTITSSGTTPNLILVSGSNTYIRPGSGYNVVVDTGNGLQVTSGDIRTPTYYISSDTSNRFASGALVLRGQSPTIWFRDTDQNSAMIHVNSNIFYVLRGANDTETWTQVNSVWPLQIDLTNNNATFGGTVTAPTFSGAFSGNATTASSAATWTTARNFSIGGTSKSVNGSADVTWTTSEIGINNATLTLNTSGNGLSGSQTFTANQSTAATFTVTSNATNANTASTIVFRDASGNFSAGTISANLNSSADQGILTQNNGNASQWYGRILSKNSTSDKAAFLGTYGSVAGVFAHNNALSAWADIYVNTVDGSTGGAVRMPSSVLINGNQAIHAGNYTSYAPTLTGTGASGTWGISITGNAATATSADQIDGVAFRNTGSNSGTAADSLDSNGITYANSNVSIFSGITDGALYSQAYSSAWQHQIYGDYRSGQIVVRGKNSGTWQSWRTVLDSSNYTSYVGNGTLTLSTSSPLSGSASFTANQSGNSTFTVSHNTSGVTAGTYKSVTVDNYGHVTSGTNPTTLAGYGITDVGNGTLTLAVSGTGLSGSASFTANQSGNATFTVTSNATNANTASTIVARDASGNFSAGTITAALSGNATTATTWQTARNLSIGGTSKSVNGSADVTWSTSEIGINNATLTLNVSGNGLSGSQTFTANQSTAATFTVTSNATTSNTASTLVYRGGSGEVFLGDVYSANWFRVNGTNGLYAQDYGTHFYANSDLYWNIAGNNSQGNGGLRFRIGHQGTTKGLVYWDGAGFGLLNNDGNWAVRSNYNGQWSGGTLYGAWTKASSNYTSGITLPGMFIQSGTSTGVPTAIANGDLWWNTDTGKLNIWWSTANAWVVATPTPDMSQYYPVGGGNINGNVSVSGLLTATGNITAVSGGSNPMTIGTHPSYGTSYAALWRQGVDYTILTDGSTNTFLNTPSAGGAIYFRTGNTTRAYVESNGYFYANRYYDLANSAYYVDPNSTSLLNSIAIAGSISNDGSVSDNDGFGIYWESGGSSAYAIYRESGAWTHPYPDLRIAFHTGIKLGANSGYNGIRFYNDYDMATQVMSVNNASDALGANNVYVNNSLQAGSSLRAPVFYDSNDTTYFVDPAADSITSGLSAKLKYSLEVNGAGSSAGFGLALYPSWQNSNGTSTEPTYGIMFASTSTYGTHGNVSNSTDWATYFTMNNTSNRGWIFRNVNTGNVASINNVGYARFQSLGINTNASGTAGEIRATDNITAYYSDERLKTKLGPIENPIEKVKALSGFYFEANETAVALGYQKKREIGVSAQEVQAILPEIVTTAPISDEYLTVRYEKMIPLLIEAIKAQQVQIDELKALLASKA